MKIFGLCFLFILLSITASASTVVFGPVYLTNGGTSLVPTDWIDHIALPQFDPSLGTLTQADFSFTATVASDFQVENRDNTPQDITIDVTGTIIIYGPDSNVLTFTIPDNSQVFHASAFDGIVDFGGTSGETVTGLTAGGTGLATVDSSSASLLSQFIGTGTVSVEVDSFGNSSSSGPAVLTEVITTVAGAYGSVTYTYTPTAVPEPGTFAAGGASLLLLGLLKRKRRS